MAKESKKVSKPDKELGTPENKDKLRAVEDVVKGIQERYGEGSIMKMGGMRKVDV